MENTVNLSKWVMENSEMTPLQKEDLASPFHCLIRDTKGISGKLHNEISDNLLKAYKDPRDLVEQLEDKVDVIKICVDFDQPSM
ncbi:MAG: hypothetical protein HQL97_07705 [Magnetococcales bacterium]|nr:hypothetical protein [Magnetococcales bacterium]